MSYHRLARAVASTLMHGTMSSWIEGRTFLVTGSTDGIGLHTAKRLAQAQGRVIVHGRNAKRVEKTVKEIVKETGNREISSYVYDLSSMDAVRRFAQDIRQHHESIDVLINNAGVFEESKSVTVDGMELTWAVNVVAPYLLICHLLDRVTERIVNVSSISAAGSIDFDNLQQQKGYSAHNAYSLSKLCMMLMTFPLAAQLREISPVTMNCLDPGTVNTKMLYAGWGSIGISVSDADNEFYAATSPDIATVTGEYFVQRRITRPPAISRDKSTQEHLLKILEEQTSEKLDISKAMQKT